FFGLAFWYAGMNHVLIRMPLASRIVVGAIPLLGLPWFARELPNALRHASVEVASTFGDTMEDIETTSRISATDPANASMQDGARLTFAIEKGLYADTFGTLHFVPPTAPFPEGNAAFAALTRSAT